MARLASSAEETSGRLTLVPGELSTFVTGAILAAVAYLEATINELLADCSEPLGGRLGQLGPAKVAELAALWDLGVPRRASYRILDKFEFLLIVARQSRFDQGSLAYQDASLLIELRNTLIHFEPEWILLRDDASGRRTGHKFDEKLKGKFPPNGRAKPSEPFFPYRCLGTGCAEWSIAAATSFVNYFWDALGIRPEMAAVWRGEKMTPGTGAA